MSTKTTSQLSSALQTTTKIKLFDDTISEKLLLHNPLSLLEFHPISFLKAYIESHFKKSVTVKENE